MVTKENYEVTYTVTVSGIVAEDMCEADAIAEEMIKNEDYEISDWRTELA